MRKHGRLLKNFSGLLLLLALLALLLPFCRFDAAGQPVTLSGADVISAGTRAGYSYITEGRVPDDLVLKSPFTWGEVKNGLHLAGQAGLEKPLILGGTAIALPVFLCFLSMCLLFIASGKKLMVLPTLFTMITCAGLFLAKAAFSGLDDYLQTGCYLFAFLNAAALILILLGWITGGYRKPKEPDTGEKRTTEKEEKTSRKKNSKEDSKDRDRSRKRRSDKDSGKKKKKKHSKESTDRGKKDKSSGQSENNNTSSQNEKSASSANAGAAGRISGRLFGGTGIYHGYDLSFDGRQKSVTLGTTQEAILSLQHAAPTNLAQIAEHSCRISYDPAAHIYTVANHSREDICLRHPESGTNRYLHYGEKVKFSTPVTLTVNGAENSVRLN